MLAAGGGAVLLRRSGGASDIVWRVGTSGDSALAWQPHIVGGLVLAGDLGSRLHAFDIATGQEKWVAPVQEMGMSVPGTADGIVVFHEDREVHALDLTSGKVLWSKQVHEASLQPAAAVAGGLVYVTGRRGDSLFAAVHIFEARTGADRPPVAVQTGRGITGSVTVSGPSAYVATEEGEVLMFDTSTGRQRRRSQVIPAAPLRSTPVVAAGRVFVTSDKAALYALDAATGRQLWAKETNPAEDVNGTPIVVDGIAPSVVDDTVYLGSGGALHAFAAADGTVRWHAAIGDARESQVYSIHFLSPAVIGATACVSDGGRSVVGLDVATGRTRWTRNADARPVAAGGLFHLATLDGLISLDPADGRIVRTIGEEHDVHMPQHLTVAGDLLLVVESSSRICAIRLP